MDLVKYEDQIIFKPVFHNRLKYVFYPSDLVHCCILSPKLHLNLCVCVYVCITIRGSKKHFFKIKRLKKET